MKLCLSVLIDNPLIMSPDTQGFKPNRPGVGFRRRVSPITVDKDTFSSACTWSGMQMSISRLRLPALTLTNTIPYITHSSFKSPWSLHIVFPQSLELIHCPSFVVSCSVWNKAWHVTQTNHGL